MPYLAKRRTTLIDDANSKSIDISSSTWPMNTCSSNSILPYVCQNILNVRFRHHMKPSTALLSTSKTLMTVDSELFDLIEIIVANGVGVVLDIFVSSEGSCKAVSPLERWVLSYEASRSYSTQCVEPDRNMKLRIFAQALHSYLHLSKLHFFLEKESSVDFREALDYCIDKLDDSQPSQPPGTQAHVFEPIETSLGLLSISVYTQVHMILTSPPKLKLKNGSESNSGNSVQSSSDLSYSPQRLLFNVNDDLVCGEFSSNKSTANSSICVKTEAVNLRSTQCKKSLETTNIEPLSSSMPLPSVLFPIVIYRQPFLSDGEGSSITAPMHVPVQYPTMVSSLRASTAPPVNWIDMMSRKPSLESNMSNVLIRRHSLSNDWGRSCSLGSFSKSPSFLTFSPSPLSVSSLSINSTDDSNDESIMNNYNFSDHSSRASRISRGMAAQPLCWATSRSKGNQRPLLNSAPATNVSKIGRHYGCLLGSLEESLLTGRMSEIPAGIVNGFTAELGVCGKGVCPSHARISFAARFYHVDADSTPSPYVGLIDLEGGLPLTAYYDSENAPISGKWAAAASRGLYRCPPDGSVQVAVFNPNRTLVKVFVIVYSLKDMPGRSKTFVRQKTVTKVGSRLRAAIHLRFIRPRDKSAVYLHKEIRVIFQHHMPDDNKNPLIITEYPHPRYSTLSHHL